jgi:hypothetical protein
VVLMGCAVESPVCYPSPWCWWAGRPDAIRLSCRGCGGTAMEPPRPGLFAANLIAAGIGRCASRCWFPSSYFCRGR